MKNLITLLLIPFYLSVDAQKVALFDTNFKNPILYTDSVTVQQVGKLIPVGINDFDTLYANLKYLDDMLKKMQRSKMQSFELRAGNTVISTARKPRAYGDSYFITLTTNVNNIVSVHNLADQKNNKQNSLKIEKFMSYMQQNKSLFKANYEIIPKLYNVVVISE